MLLQSFVGHKSRAEDQEEWPAHPEAATAEIKDQKGAEQSAEKKLKRVDEPERSFGWVLGIGVAIIRTVDENDAYRHDGEVRNDPEIFPERIDALKRHGVKGESTEEGDR
jgi:hypothetical protein